MNQKKLVNLKIVPKIVRVRTICSIKISFCLEFDIPEDSFLIFRFRGGRNNKNDWYLLQSCDPNMNGFASIYTEPPLKLIPITITGKELMIKYLITEKGGMKKGTNVLFKINNTLAQSLVENDKKIEFYIKTSNQEMISFSNQPSLNVVNEDFDHITLICPSTTIVNQKFKVHVRIEDKYKNLVRDFQGKLKLSIVELTNKKELSIGDVHIFENDEGLYSKTDVIIPTSGIYIVKGVYNNHEFISNPFETYITKPEKSLYWGYIHGHTNKSDGMRSPSEYFNNLMDAGLDFGTNTEHDHLYETSDEDFKEIRTIIQKYHRENEFITFFGYEYGTWFTGYGDICIYHYEDGIPIIRSEINKFNSPLKLNKKLKNYKGNVLLISHHSALRAGFRNWDQFDNTIEKLVEIYSTWGNQEYSSYEGNPLPPRYKFYGYGKHALKRGAILEKKGSFVKDALQKGYKLGFTAGGDDHFGFYPSGQIDPDNGLYHPGIMAIWSRDLTKKSIWNSLNQRKCYGTTGPRVIIEFSIDNHSMGDIIELSKNKKISKIRELHLSIISPIKITKIEFIRNNEVFNKIKPEENIFKGTFIDDIALDKLFLTHVSQKEKFVFYYIRIFLENENMAWASPIWIVQP